MLSRLVRVFQIPGTFLLLFGLLVCRAEKAPTEINPGTPTLILDGLGRGTAALDGPWQFHLGDDPAWAKPELDDSAAKGWEQLTADQGWGAQGHDSHAGFGWYRRHIRVNPAPGAPMDFAVLLGEVDDVYEVYWNGVLVGGRGKLPPYPVWYFRPPPHTFGLGEIHSGVLAVRVWKAPLSSFDSGQIGGFEAVPLLGSAPDVAAAKAVGDYQWMRSRQLSFGVLFLYVLVAVLGFAAWLRDRKEWISFWMAAFCFSPAMNAFLGGLRLPIPYPLVVGGEQPMFAIWDISLWFLLLWLLQLRNEGRLVRWVRVAAIVDMAASLLDGLLNLPSLATHWQMQTQIADGVLTALVTVLEVIPILLLIRALVRRRRLGAERWLVAIFACCAEGIELLQTTAEQGERFTHWTWGNKLSAQLFAVNGNAVTAPVVARTLLLLALIYAIYRNSVDSRRRQAEMEQEFRNARELQQVLIPDAFPEIPGFALTSAYKPALEVGGDFFQIIPLENSSTLMILGDVSGKGLKAAMAVSLIVGAMRMIVEYTDSPAEILAGLNRRLHGRLSGGFATAIAVRLDTHGSCVLASAGHLAPFLNQSEFELPGALPLGLSLDATYEETAFQLGVGDHFALYTDGLLEARSHSGELYGFERLEALFATYPNAAQATEAAVKFGQDDDITVLTLTRLATGEEPTAVHSAPTLAPV